MQCPRCGHLSSQLDCRRCGLTPRIVKTFVGFYDPILGTDVPVPTPGSGYQLGKDVGQDIPTPGTAYDLGKSAGTAITTGTGQVSDLVRTLKYAAIGGAVLVGGLIAYSLYRAWDEKMGNKVIEHVSNAEDAVSSKLIAKGV